MSCKIGQFRQLWGGLSSYSSHQLDSDTASAILTMWAASSFYFVQVIAWCENCQVYLNYCWIWEWRLNSVQKGSRCMRCTLNISFRVCVVVCWCYSYLIGWLTVVVWICYCCVMVIWLANCQWACQLASFFIEVGESGWASPTSGLPSFHIIPLLTWTVQQQQYFTCLLV